VLEIREPIGDSAENGPGVIGRKQDRCGAVEDGASEEFVPSLLATG
jgi:hypothetical protein